MYSIPFNINNINLITSVLQQRTQKFLNFPDLYAEPISEEELRCCVPSLFEQFTQLGIVFDVARFFSTPPGQILPIHRDGTDDQPKYWALNLPIYNCKNTSMIWYKTDASVYYYHKSNYSPAPISCYPIEECVEVERCQIDKPTWVKVDTPHTVDNPTNAGNRIIISLRFDVTQLKDWNPNLLPVVAEI